MRLTLLAAALVANILVTQSIAAAQESDAACRGVYGGGLRVGCDGSWGSHGSGSTAPDGSGGGGGAPVDPRLVGNVITFSTDPTTGARCFTRTLQQLSDVNAAEAQNINSFRLLENTTDAACPDAPAAPAISPEEVAFAFWEEVDPPDPQPEVAPVWAITGLPSYLEPGVQTNLEQTFATILGPLTITATGAEIEVDWGDGTTSNTVDPALGGPWPNGDITHSYTDVGTVTITVTQYWTGTWSIPRIGAGGTFTKRLEQTATIPDFDVEQVQAVIQ